MRQPHLLEKYLLIDTFKVTFSKGNEITAIGFAEVWGRPPEDISAVSARMVVRASSASFELGALERKPTHTAIFVCPEEVIDSVIVFLASCHPGSQVTKGDKLLDIENISMHLTFRPQQTLWNSERGN